MIADVIQELTPQQQTAYKLSRDEGLSYQQIAEKDRIVRQYGKSAYFTCPESITVFF